MELTLENIANDPYQNLVDYLNNEVTRKCYLRTLKNFLNVIPKKIFTDNLQKSGETVPELATLFVELAQKDIQLVKQIIHAYVREVKITKEKKKLKNSYIKNQLKPIVSLFDANEIDFSWKVINKGLPKTENSTDRAYTTKELQTLMLRSCDIVDKIIVVLFSSAGFRLGAWDYFTWNDVIFFSNPDESAKGLGLRVYAGDAEEYWTHGTPEAAKLLSLYREEWKERFGKYPESSDPLIVSTRIRAMTRLSSAGVAGRVRELLNKSGLKDINVQQDNGFRKFFNTMCRRAKIFEEDREDMMGHYEGLQKHYERYIEEDFERFPEYQKAITFLSISDEERNRAELVAKDLEIDELTKKNRKINELEMMVKELNDKGSINPDEATKKLVLTILKEQQLINSY